MDITCGDCGARFRLDPALLKDSSAAHLRCRKCGGRIVVRKTREIYRHEGVQVHVDDVERLGHFVEFELAVEDTPDAVADGRARLAAMKSSFGIPDEDLVASSYSDLLAD